MMRTLDIKITNATITNNPTIRWNSDYCQMEFVVTFELENGDHGRWARCLNEQNIEKLKKLFAFVETDTTEGEKIRIAHDHSIIGFGHPTEDRFIWAALVSPCEELTFAQLCDEVNK